MLTMTLFAVQVSAQETDCNHAFDQGVVQKEATCTEEGQMLYRCTLCGIEKTEAIARTDHHFGQPQNVDAVSHKVVCSVCGKEQAESHSWDQGTVTKEPNCTTEGKKTFHCACGAEKTESVKAAGHTYGAWSGNESGHSRVCTVCSHKEQDSHNWDKGSIVQKAWCTTDGIRKFTCIDCGMELLNAIAKLGHAYENDCDPGCDRCGEERDASHKYATVWSKDAEGHWHACTKCGNKRDFTKHFPGPEATETTDQVCMTCDYVIKAKINHVHTYKNTWSSDEAGHWYQCEGCGHEDKFAVHAFKTGCTSKCIVCGYERDAEHTFDGVWKSDENGHWFVCSACGEETTLEAHTAGPEATDEEGQLCLTCGYVMEEALEHTHSFGPEWLHDADNHWQECDCGETAVPRGHTWDEGKEMTNGTLTRTCTVCGETMSEAVEHGFPWGILILVLVLLAGGAGAAWYFLYYQKTRTGKYAA